MRSSDEYVGLMAAALGVGAVVAWAAEAPWFVIAVFLTVAGAALVGMAWRASRSTRVLLVGEPEPLYRMREALDDAGLAVRTCDGPGARPCPVLHGKPCPVRGHPAVALIYRAAGDTGRPPPCGSGLGVPTLSMWGGDDREPLAPGQQRQILQVVRGLADRA